MTLKQTITQELLDAVDDQGGLEDVFRRYSHSKGPFYLGLAEATFQLELRFNEAVQQAFEAKSQKQDRQEQRDSLKEQTGE